MKLKIYFNNHVIGTVEDDVETFELHGDFPPNMAKFVSNYIENTLHFKSYYWNCAMKDENTLWIDYGSHTNFITVVKQDG